MANFFKLLIKQISGLDVIANSTLPDKLSRWAWFIRFIRWQKAHPSPVSNWRPAIYQDFAKAENLATIPLTYLEFGTHEGRSIKWWLEINKHPDSRFFGFDTFSGLPQNWESFSKGYFDVKGNTPQVGDSRCAFVKGLFQETLLDHLKVETPSGRKVFHLDADLYGSTIYVLCTIAPILKSGDYLIFDEMHVWMDEFRAFMNFLECYPIKYSCIHRSPDWSQVVIRIESDGPVFH